MEAFSCVRASRRSCPNGVTLSSNHYLQNKCQTNLIRTNFIRGNNNYDGKRLLSTSFLRLYLSDNNEMDQTISVEAWNPRLRKTIAAISSLGILETAYLTFDKMQFSAKKSTTSLVSALCNSSSSSGGGGSCNDVLHGPYSALHVGAFDIPLSLLGMVAYTIAFCLSILPLAFYERNDNGGGENAVLAIPDAQNRIALLGVTTLMASFSVYLVSLLVGVLHATCLFCFLSAVLSVSMAGFSWFGGLLPGSSAIDDDDDEIAAREGIEMSMALEHIAKLRKDGIVVGASSVGLATVMALGIFLTVDDVPTSISASSRSSSGTLLASTSKTAVQYQENVPPPITTTSSKAALVLASDLNSLNARMYGAFWCSHCYDQKQALGYEAMQTIPYIECDREGFNNKRDFCKEKDVPGYPTWEIGGTLFPGERSLEELREIVDDVISSNGAK